MAVYVNSREAFADINGNPIQGGTLYIGEPDQDPVANPKAITDLDGNTISSSVTLDNLGVPTIAFIVDGDFSQAVYDSNAVEITSYQIKRAAGVLTEGDISSITTQGAPWVSTKTYNIPDFVSGSDDNHYISLTNNNLGNDPTATPTSWSRLAFSTLWNIAETYQIDDTCIGDDGMTYRSTTNGNTGNDPTTDEGVNWSDPNDSAALSTIDRRNFVVNPNFKINQRVFGGGQPAAGVYGFDQWKGDVLGTRIEQVIVNSETYLETFTISWTGGTGTADVDGTTGLNSGDTFTLNTSANFSVIVPTNATKIILSRGSSTGTYTPRDDGEELKLCQPFLFKTYDQLVAAGTVDSSGAKAAKVQSVGSIAHGVQIDFPVTMAGTPTIESYSPISGLGTNRIRVGSTDYNTAIGQLGESGCFVATSAPIVGAVNETVQAHVVAKVEL